MKFTLPDGRTMERYGDKDWGLPVGANFLEMMDDETREALDDCIEERWRPLLARKDGESAYPPKTCSLCLLFDAACVGAPECTRNDGVRCPVYQRTGRPNCWGTPYWDWHAAYRESAFGTTPRIRELVQAEIDFLESLRGGR